MTVCWCVERAQLIECQNSRIDIPRNAVASGLHNIRLKKKQNTFQEGILTNRKIKASVYLLFLLALISTQILTGCTTTYCLSPVPWEDKEQSCFWANGDEVAFSKCENSEVALYILKTEENELLLHILYKNTSDTLVDVFPDQIRINFYNDHGATGNVFVYDANDYIKKMKRKLAWQQFGIVLRSISQSIKSRTSTTYATVGNQSVYLKTHDIAKQALVNQQNQENMRRVIEQGEILNASVEMGLIKRNTLSPGYYIEGNVMAKFKRGHRYIVTIPFGDDRHVIEFRH